MNNRVVLADGRLATCGEWGAGQVIDRLVLEATIPATYDEDAETITPATHDANGMELTPAVVNRVVLTPAFVPNAADLAVEVTPEELKVHPWRVPKVRAERLQQIRSMRNAKLDAIDREIQDTLVEVPGANRTLAGSRTEKQTLRDLPTVAEAALLLLNNTDDIEAYTPIDLL